MIAYVVPHLQCECSWVLVNGGQTRLGGRIIYLCGNKDCRHYHKVFTYKPIEHQLEQA